MRSLSIFVTQIVFLCRYVVRDVIDSLRREMQADNVSTAPLDELKRLWRAKMYDNLIIESTWCC